MIYNARPVLVGLLLFLCLCGLPFLRHAGRVYTKPAPAPAGVAKDCIEPRSYMAANHMQLLLTWRDDATRGNKREYTAADGRVWPISLQNTCLSCHADKEKFCDACHNSLAVTPRCWDCHSTSAEGAGGRP